MPEDPGEGLEWLSMRCPRQSSQNPGTGPRPPHRQGSPGALGARLSGQALPIGGAGPLPGVSDSRPAVETSVPKGSWQTPLTCLLPGDPGGVEQPLPLGGAEGHGGAQEADLQQERVSNNKQEFHREILKERVEATP